MQTTMNPYWAFIRIQKVQYWNYLQICIIYKRGCFKQPKLHRNNFIIELKLMN